VCDGILERFEEAAVPLAEEFGALPVIGIGHSLGALLQVSSAANMSQSVMLVQYTHLRVARLSVSFDCVSASHDVTAR
jgi:hypothetical protein